ncbi:hypothetical protein AKJ39_03315 [candidate division MSBL1 archaeon SCGC-AAA259J03]|uniref:Radical SAM core domain-containing protein n=1 Tax=candidate division MSBL1 archaeon SCGC-AAA259J03 TaxID=1698269 RepID=A0A656YW28_9EURY|nr:hypothetical protein AKJ39_03315 [candidate division MSBL1 archaeon SCGC-AAA259J03]
MSRAFLRLVTGRTDHGNRLDLALQDYAGMDVSDDLSYRDKLASMLVSFVMDRGSDYFGVDVEEMRETMKDPIIRRGISNVIEGIAEHGIQRPFTSVAPFLVVWDYTSLCNLRCKHCYENASPEADTSEELSTEEAKHFIDEFKRAGGVAIAFSGGEPLMRDDFFEVAKYAKEQNFFVSIATNGTLITKEIAEKLSKIIEYAEISLDGFEETHDEFRGVKGSWKKAYQGIRNSVEAGIDTCVALTATHYNLDEIPELIEFAEEDLGVKKAIIFNYIPVRKGKEIIDMDLSPDERWELLEDLYSKLIDENNPMTLYSTAPQYAAVSWEFAHGPAIATHFTNEAAIRSLRGRTKSLAQFLGGCGAGRLYCAIEPNGDVEPCVFIPIKIGNIREQSLREIWENSPVLRKIRNRDEFEGCGDCDYKYICGGCRARAYGYYDDLQGPDPSCPENEEYWKKIQEKS